MDLHKLLQPYEWDNKYYYAEAADILTAFLSNYSDNHPWFHWHLIPVDDSDPEHYFHYAIIYWTEGTRPTINSFNFIDA